MESRNDILKYISENATSMKATIGLSVKEPHLFAFIAHELCKQNELLEKLIDILGNKNEIVGETSTVQSIDKTAGTVSKEDLKNTAKK